MRRSWAAVTVGALTLVVMVASYLIFRYTNERMGWDEGYVVYAYFNNAIGIYKKSGVRSAGIDVGQIEDKTYDPIAKKAKISIRIFPEIKLYENAAVQKRSASLLGEYYLDLDLGTPYQDGRAMRLLKSGDLITNVYEPTEVSQILDQVGTTLPVLKEILRDVQNLTGGPVKEIAENTNQLIERNSIVLERLLQRVDNVAANIETITAKETEDITVALRNVREITEGLKSLVGKSEGEVTATGQELRSSVQKLEKSIDSLETSMTNVETITERLKDGEGTAGKLLTDDTIANNIQDITEDAGGFLRGVTRLQTKVGLRTEYNYIANTFKNYFSLQLSPRPDRYYLFEIVDDPRGFRSVERTTTNSSVSGQTEETKFTTSDKLRFSLMFARRIGIWTGRFGLKESTGGFGSDLHFMDDRLSLSADLFDARSNEYPRLQGRAAVSFYGKNLYLIAGVDDVLNRQQAAGSGGAFFDWFFGLQLMFRDEDLKSLLLFGGGALGAAAGK